MRRSNKRFQFQKPPPRLNVADNKQWQHQPYDYYWLFSSAQNERKLDTVDADAIVEEAEMTSLPRFQMWIQQKKKSSKFMLHNLDS